MNHRSNYVIDLIDSYSSSDVARIPASLSNQEVQHLYEVGLASIALHRLASNLDSTSETSRQLLQNADFTARVIYGQLRATTIEILELARKQDIPIVLLKGISIADDLYLQPHHRLMGDIDVLAPVERARELQDALSGIGYRSPEGPQATTLAEGHHHLPEIRHPESGISVEIHTALFSATPMSSEPLFQIPTIWSCAEPSEYHGARCLFLRREFQLVYTIAHWAVDQKWTRNIVSINDMVLILRRTEPQIDWTLIASWLPENPLVTNCLTVILSFLDDAGFINIPAAIKEEIDASAQRIGAANMKIMHWLMLKFPLSGSTTVPSPVTRLIARVVWQTMLEPRHKFLRPFVAVARIFFRRSRGKSVVGSIPGRIRTFIRLMREPQ